METPEIEAAQLAIQKGEEARILFNLLLSTIGLEPYAKHPLGDVWERLKQTQAEYNEALTLVETVIKDTHEQRRKEVFGEGVSVSNY